MLNFIGFLLPALIDLFNRRIKDSDVRFWVSVLVCIFFGVFLVTLDTNAFQGLTAQAVAEEIAMRSLALFGMAQLTYKKVWENSDTRDSMGLNAKKNVQ
jgi:hypothetical protein